jgi:hypothetical protein
MSSGWKEPPEVEGDEADDSSQEALTAELRTLLEQREFNYILPPERPHPVLMLGDKTICTPGNLSNIQGPAKTAKSTVVGAILASAMKVGKHQTDTLGFVSENPKGWAVLHFDTEQSPFDHHALVTRALERAGTNTPPAWLHSYCLTDLGLEDRRLAILTAIADADKKHKGVLMVIIDGVADLCVDPNDAKEAFKLVSSLHTAAIRHECAIITVLHENPGSDIGKMRGHLGSQLERKAETPLRLQKDANTGIITMWSDRARHCHIPKSQGSCFVWSDEAQMHVSCGDASEVRLTGNRRKFEGEVVAAFGEAVTLAYKQLTEQIVKTTGLRIDAAKKRVKSYLDEGLITKNDDGSYCLTTVKNHDGVSV